MSSALATAAVRTLLPALVAAVVVPGCVAEPAEQAGLIELDVEFDLTPRPDPARAAPLAWRAPLACPQVYRVRIDESYPPGLEERLHTRAEHSDSFIAISSQRAKDGEVLGRLMFQGPRTQDRPVLRDFAISAELAGPAAPDAPCRERTWDPVEDALALGWPQLPARLVARGETWRGARVEATCNRSACVDPKTGGGGPDNHHRPCATMSWRERLDGLYTLGDEQVAQISSFWSDGHPLGEALWSERSAVVSVAHGRLLHSQTVIHHGYSGIEREVRVDAIDGCAGGLVAAGWSPDPVLVAARDALLTAAEAPMKGRAQPPRLQPRKQAPERGR